MEEIRKKLLLDMGFSQKAVQILDQNLNMGTMKHPVITEQHQGTCGDILFLSLNIEGKIIQDAMFEYIGCAGLQSCASAIIELIRGKSIDYALNVEIEDIVGFLGGIPRQKFECAEIARDTLRKAINSHQNTGLNVIN